jgi:UDPglucose 6-dehydrogenase
MIAQNMAAGRLRFSTDIGGAVGEADLVFLTVGTPGRRDGGADLRAVDAVAASVAERVTHPTVLVLKSTVPVGTNERVQKIVASAAFPVHVVSNPEFLKEGAAIKDFLHPERIVCGDAGTDERVRQLMERLYHPYCLSGSRLMWMSPASAELTKYVSNTMLAMRISFMNEVALLAEKAGANIHDVRHAVGADSRIGDKFLHAGAGYGGSCFPKDVLALATAGRDFGVPMELSEATHRVNERQKSVIVAKLKSRFGGTLRGKRIAVWGIAFKPDTDDIREAPALTTIDVLLSEGASVVAHDPKAMEEFRKHHDVTLDLVERPVRRPRRGRRAGAAHRVARVPEPGLRTDEALMRRPFSSMGATSGPATNSRSRASSTTGLAFARCALGISDDEEKVLTRIKSDSYANDIASFWGVIHGPVRRHADVSLGVGSFSFERRRQLERARAKGGNERRGDVRPGARTHPSGHRGGACGG